MNKLSKNETKQIISLLTKIKELYDFLSDIDEESHLMESLLKIDLEIDHNHDTNIDIVYKFRGNDILIYLTDSSDSWKNYLTGKQAYILVEHYGHHNLKMSTLAFTEFPDLPPVIQSRVYNTLRYISEKSETWIKGIDRTITDRKAEIKKQEFPTLPSVTKKPEDKKDGQN